MNPNPGFDQQPQYGQQRPAYGAPPGPPYPPNPNNDSAVAAAAHWSPAVLALLFAFLVPLLGALTPFVPPLIMFVSVRSPFVKEHARQSLNFQLTVLLPGIVFAVLAMVLSFGWVFSLVLYLGALAPQIMGAVQAANGQWFRYPVAIPFVPVPGPATNWAPPN
ncbi:MAG TPA: DUF4870 domain-containing protein [Pseudonocardiaceae bacterium]|jgi:uncharacterized Tic20 family protein|nr:DUF4870 domain-containing protein [Pseudonocardiaceae bacterium]